MPKLPKHFKEFVKNHPGIGDAYRALSDATHAAGPLDSKTRALIKLGIAVGGRMEGAVHSHVRKCLGEGCTQDEIRHAILLSTTTIGFPNMMAALSWAEDVFDKEP